MDNNITTKLTEEDVLSLGWEKSLARDTLGIGNVYVYLQRFPESNKLIFYSLSKQSYKIEDKRFFLTWNIINTITDYAGELNLVLEDKTDLQNLMKILDIKNDGE